MLDLTYRLTIAEIARRNMPKGNRPSVAAWAGDHLTLAEQLYLAGDPGSLDPITPGRRLFSLSNADLADAKAFFEGAPAPAPAPVAKPTLTRAQKSAIAAAERQIAARDKAWNDAVAIGCNTATTKVIYGRMLADAGVKRVCDGGLGRNFVKKVLAEAGV